MFNFSSAVEEASLRHLRATRRRLVALPAYRNFPVASFSDEADLLLLSLQQWLRAPPSTARIPSCSLPPSYPRPPLPVPRSSNAQLLSSPPSSTPTSCSCLRQQPDPCAQPNTVTLGVVAASSQGAMLLLLGFLSLLFIGMFAFSVLVAMTISAPCCFIAWPVILVCVAFLLPVTLAAFLSLVSVALIIRLSFSSSTKRAEPSQGRLTAVSADDSHIRARIKLLMEKARRAPALMIFFGGLPTAGSHK